MSNESDSCYCTGSIKPYRFVKNDTANQRCVLPAGAGGGSHGDKPFGISDKGTWQPPLNLVGGTVGLDDGYAGIVGSPPITVWLENAECCLCAGGVVAIDDELKSDSDGRGITAGTTGDWVGAIALEPAAAAGQLIKVRVKARRTV